MASIQGQMVLTFPAATGTARATLRVASFPSLDRAIHVMLPRWRALHPEVAVELATRRSREHHEAVARTLADPAAPAPDVVGMSMSYMGRVDPAGLEELDGPPFLAEGWVEGLVPYAVRQARTAAGRLRAVPADVGPGTLYYRADVLERAGVPEVQLCGTWEELVDAGARVKAATGASLLAHPADLKDLYLRAHMEEGEGLYFSQAGEPLVRSPRFVEAFRLAAAARRAGVDAGIAPGWSDAWVDLLRSGALAAHPTGAWFLAHLSSWIAPETRGLWRCCQGPGTRRACWGGAFYAIPRRAARKELALDFIRLACGDRAIQLGCFRSVHAFPALLEAQDDPSFDEPLPFLGGQPARRLWQRLVKDVRAGPVHALDEAAETAVNGALEQVLAGRQEIEVALAAAEQALRRRAAGRG